MSEPRPILVSVAQADAFMERRARIAHRIHAEMALIAKPSLPLRPDLSKEIAWGHRRPEGGFIL